MIKIVTNKFCLQEKEYIFEYIFTKIGIKYVLVVDDVKDYHIVNTVTQRKIIFSDLLFNYFQENWLVDCKQILTYAKLNYQLMNIVLPNLNGKVSIPFGSGRFANDESQNTYIDFDVFGSCFYLLSRYEEIKAIKTDKHGRFSYKDSFAFNSGSLTIPLVDVYVRVFRKFLEKFLELTLPSVPSIDTGINVSCDVDIPFATPGSLAQLFRRNLKQIILGDGSSSYKENIKEYREQALSNYVTDQFRQNLEFIACENSKLGRSVTFYIIPHNTHPLYDNIESITSRRFISVIQYLYSKGHEIGVHPGYYTCSSGARMRHSVDKFKKFYENNLGYCSQIHSRQHFLRWDPINTPNLLHQNLISTDSTLGFAGHVGFRSGTCQEYYLYDLKNRRKTNVIQKPLNVMDSTLFASYYMNIKDIETAFDTVKNLFSICKSYNGNLNILWHNSYFDDPAYYEFYRQIIRF